MFEWIPLPPRTNAKAGAISNASAAAVAAHRPTTWDGAILSCWSTFVGRRRSMLCRTTLKVDVSRFWQGSPEHRTGCSCLSKLPNLERVAGATKNTTQHYKLTLHLNCLAKGI